MAKEQQALPGIATIPGSATAQPASIGEWFSRLQHQSDLLIAAGIVAILALLIIPISPTVLDFMLAVNITFSVLILMVALYIRSPLDMSIFPTILLVATLFRLGLNVASTRLILSEATAGRIIQAFGDFVISGNYIVGLIIFIILVVINFIVIIKGSSRIAEVAARFTLDALPGKQMSIDADLNAGFISEEEARKRREQLNRESEFYGAMDGAAKFVRGDAIAGLVITGINILGGFGIGVLQKGMSISDALQTYTVLTIGDGLVSQIPALLISVAAGLVVTRSASGKKLEEEMGTQFTQDPRALFVASAILILFALLPGFPFLPFFLLSLTTGAIGYARRQMIAEEAQRKIQQELAEAQKKKEAEEKPVEELLFVDPVEVELGYGLLSLIDQSQGGDLFQRIANIRRQLAYELGFILPPVRVRDNLRLQPEEYVVKIRGNVVARNMLYPDMVLAMNPGTAEGELQGIRVREPVFGLPAIWIPPGARQQAEIMGYTVVEPAAVLTTHLTEIFKKYAYKILDRQAVQQLIENLRKEYPLLAEEIAPDKVPISVLEKVLQNLLREQIPIKDLALIIEALSDYIKATTNVEVLTEYVRHALSDTIRQLYQDENGIVHGVTVSPQLEQAITSALQDNQRTASPTLGFSPEFIEQLRKNTQQALEELNLRGYKPIILTSALIRSALFRLLSPFFPEIHVVSFSELPPDTEVDILAVIEMPRTEELPSGGEQPEQR